MSIFCNPYLAPGWGFQNYVCQELVICSQPSLANVDHHSGQFQFLMVLSQLADARLWGWLQWVPSWAYFTSTCPRLVKDPGGRPIIHNELPWAEGTIIAMGMLVDGFHADNCASLVEFTSCPWLSQRTNHCPSHILTRMGRKLENNEYLLD